MTGRNERRRSTISGRSSGIHRTSSRSRDQAPTTKATKKSGERNENRPAAVPQNAPGGDNGATTKKERKVTRIKVISMGDAGTGKTCLIKRHCEGRFVSRYIPTIGIDYGVKPERIRTSSRGGGGGGGGGGEENERIEARVNFFDFSGDPDYLDVRNEFYSDASGAFLVYDASDRSTFARLGKWLEEMKEYLGGTDGDDDPSTAAAAADIPVALCANKVDKVPRQVKESDGLAFASANGLSYFESSAKSGEGVSAMFEALFQTIAKRPPVSGWK